MQYGNSFIQSRYRHSLHGLVLIIKKGCMRITSKSRFSKFQAERILNCSSSELKKYLDDAFNLRRKNFGDVLWNYAKYYCKDKIEDNV